MTVWEKEGLDYITFTILQMLDRCSDPEFSLQEKTAAEKTTAVRFLPSFSPNQTGSSCGSFRFNSCSGSVPLPATPWTETGLVKSIFVLSTVTVTGWSLPLPLCLSPDPTGANLCTKQTPSCPPLSLSLSLSDVSSILCKLYPSCLFFFYKSNRTLRDTAFIFSKMAYHVPLLLS